MIGSSAGNGDQEYVSIFCMDSKTLALLYVFPYICPIWLIVSFCRVEISYGCIVTWQYIHYFMGVKECPPTLHIYL